MTYEKNGKVIYNILKIKRVEETKQQFRLRKNDERRNYLLHEINHNDLMSEQYKKTCKYLNYVENLLIIDSTITDCVSISAFGSLVCVPVGITSSAKGINICAIIAGVKKYKPIIKKKRKKYDKLVLLGKDKLNKSLIDSFVSHEEFVSVNNVLREYNEMKNVMKNPETFDEYII